MVTSSGAAQLTKAFEHNRDRVERDLTYKHSDEKTAINAAILLRSADLRYLIGKKILLIHCISRIIIIWLRGAGFVQDPTIHRAVCSFDQ
jgi:hypothetical protein